MQQGLADTDMDFTPCGSDSWRKTRHPWIRHHLQPRRALIMARHDSGQNISELQPHRLTRVIPLTRQPEDPPYQETWEPMGLNNASSYVQELPYDWTSASIFNGKASIQPSVGRYDNFKVTTNRCITISSVRTSDATSWTSFAHRT